MLQKNYFMLIVIFGYILAVLMGATLGLIGAGGSILTVPILVYFFKIAPLSATAYSLLIVGSTALVGAISYHKKQLVNFRAAITFAIPAMLMVFFTRYFVVPNLPEKLLNIPKEIFIMLLFATLMLLAAFFMIKPIALKKEQAQKSKVFKLILGSCSIGFLTGMVGAGGGFLIIPTLILLFGLSTKEAVGTSLMIIAINSLVGFKGDLIAGIKIDWNIMAPFIALTISGMFGGIWIGKYFDGQKLKLFFALFVTLVALTIFVQEINQISTL